MRISLLFLLVFFCGSTTARAQGNIPLGSWRTHFSYARVHEVALAGNRVYAASENGFFYFDKESNETVALGPLQGFSEAGVSSLGWQQASSRLLIGYRSGNIDLIREGALTNIPAIRDAQLTGSKAIQATVFRGDSALLATDYGISIVELSQARLLDSYLNLGPAGERVRVYDVAVLRDTLYAATEAGLIANRLSSAVNLNDYRSWRRWGTADSLPAQGTHFVEVVGDQVWLATQGGSLYRKQDNSWEATAFQGREEIRDLQASQQGEILIITSATQVSRYHIGQGIFESSRYDLAPAPLTAVEEAGGGLWIGDGFNGLVVYKNGQGSRIGSDGPLSDAVTELQYDNGQLLALFGGTDASGNPLGRRGFSAFTVSEGWRNYHPQERAGSEPMPNARDLRAAAFSATTKSWYFASYSDGLLAWQPAENTFTLWGLQTPGVSFLENPGAPGSVLLSGVGVDQEGSVWMSSYNSSLPLHRFRPADGSWQGYLQNNYAASQAQQLIIPFTQDVWLRLPPEKGNSGSILVVNPAKQPTSRTLSSRGGSGGLVSDRVFVLREDLEGSVWVGTNDGLNYFPNPSLVLTNESVDALLPIYQQRPLLDESRITALAVDGGNRKWIGTINGIWVFGDAGDTLYHHFTASNSPLPSNTIIAIAVQQQTGEVFIATSKGLISYRSGATTGGNTHASAIKVFPNPVRPRFQGQVGITGLVQDAVVKITNTAGYLVRELQAEGGTAAWDQRDSRGQRVSSGVYLIFSANELGTETLVSKVAVVR